MRALLALAAVLTLGACMETSGEAALNEGPLSGESAAKLARIEALSLPERVALVEAAWIAEGCVARDADLARFNAALFARLDRALGLTPAEAERSAFIDATNDVLGDGAEALEDAGRLVYADGAERLIAPGCPV